jgi:hypothetical protein
MAHPKTQSFGRSSSISDATASLDPKPTTDYGFTSSDKAILSDYSYAAYSIAPGAFKHGLEPVLLTTIVGSSNHELDDDYLSLDKCSSLLRRNPRFRALLLSCWKDGSFQLVREAGKFVFAVYLSTGLFSSSSRGSKKANVIRHSTNNRGSNLAPLNKYQIQC